MNVWHASSHAAAGSDVLNVRPVTHDILGVFRIPGKELQTAALLGIPEHVLGHFQQTSDGTALSRSATYYEPRAGLHTAADLYEAVRVIDRRSDSPVPLLRRALVENLHNVYAAVAYALWECLTDGIAIPHADEKVLECLLEVGTRLSADLAGTAVAGWTEDPLPDLVALSPLPSFRVFRELDSQVKLHDELGFLLAHVIDPRPEISSVVIPLYGSLSLGLAARAVLSAARPGRAMSVHLIRLGFHDLSNVEYTRTDGSIRWELIGPPEYRERFASDVRDAHTLVIYDNVGYGTTLRAARALINQLGGEATTRSVETAWHLYNRHGRHDVADAADLPSLRPNLYHRVQNRLIGHLLRRDATAYLNDPAHTARFTLQQQMRATYEVALGLGTWTPDQLQVMRSELAHAALNWFEPPVPQAPTDSPRRNAA